MAVNKVNALSPIFRDMVAAYCFSKKGSFEEGIILRKIIEMYTNAFRQGDKGLCTHYLDAFFKELALRGNLSNINSVKDMFGFKNDNKKWKNSIYRRFLITIKENYNEQFNEDR